MHRLRGAKEIALGSAAFESRAEWRSDISRQHAERVIYPRTSGIAETAQSSFDGAALGGRYASGGDVKIAAATLLPALRTVLEAGFQVFAQGKRYRSLSSFDIQIESSPRN